MGKVGFMCEHNPDVCQSLSPVVFACLHELMFKRLHRSAPRAAVEATAAAGQCVGKLPRLEGMRANAVKGTRRPSNPAMSSSVHNGRLGTGLRSVQLLFCSHCPVQNMMFTYSRLKTNALNVSLKICSS